MLTYPAEARLTARRPTEGGTFGLTLTGPPGSYHVQVTGDFATWADLVTAANAVGSAEFTDSAVGQRPQGFYRVRLEP